MLHGGPDFDHRYLLPDLDRLADSVRLIYYDQRGRGASAEGVRPEDVTLESEIDDLDRVRQHAAVDSAALLGHSWGAVLDLLPRLQPLRIPTLVISGNHDFIPFEIAAHIAAAIPGARHIAFAGCGHFAYLECPDEVPRALAEFTARRGPRCDSFRSGAIEPSIPVDHHQRQIVGEPRRDGAVVDA